MFVFPIDYTCTTVTYTYAPSVCPPVPHPFTAPTPTHLPLPDTPPGGEAGTGSVPADLEKTRFLSIWRQDPESPAPAAVPQSPDPVTQSLSRLRVTSPGGCSTATRPSHPVVIKAQSHRPRGLLHSHPTQSPRRYHGARGRVEQRRHQCTSELRSCGVKAD